MKDLLFFVCFIFIFLMGFSIASWALLTTNEQVTWDYNDDGSLYNVSIQDGGSGLWSWVLLQNVTNYGVWKIFGQVDEISIKMNFFGSFYLLKFSLISFIATSDAYSVMAFVLSILFVAIANVLLLNVLVALFKYINNFFLKKNLHFSI